jgi:hypothetical protein
MLGQFVPTVRFEKGDSCVDATTAGSRRIEQTDEKRHRAVCVSSGDTNRDIFQLIFIEFIRILFKF